MSEGTLVRRTEVGIGYAAHDSARSRESLLRVLAECWERRHLIYVLLWRDMKARYKQTLLGALWAVLQPLLAMVVLTLVFSRLARIPSGGVPYPIFVFCGLLPWQFFIQGLTRSSASLLENRLLVNRLRIPRLLVPVSAVLTGSADLGISFVMLLLIMMGYGFAPRASLLLIVPLLLLAAATALALGLFLSATNVRFRDVGYIVPFFLQLAFFITPVIYPSNLVPERWRAIYSLNPMAVVVEGMRWALVGGPGIPLTTLFSSTFITVILLVLEVRFFHAQEPGFADLL
jgi:lipopolysaccharide transport system permease protein